VPAGQVSQVYLGRYGSGSPASPPATGDLTEPAARSSWPLPVTDRGERGRLRIRDV